MEATSKMLTFLVRTLIRSRICSSSCCSVIPYTTTTSSSSVVDSFLSRGDTVVSYLTRVWGLSPEQANSAAKVVKIESTESADSVFKLLKSYGFGNTDVAKLIIKQPGYVAADAKKDLRPKVEYLMSLGISESHLPAILCSNKAILSNNLKNIVPMFDFFKDFLKSNHDLVRAIRRSGRMIGYGSKSDIRRSIVPNISTLQARGVPYHVIVRLLAWNPAALRLRTVLFERAVKRVEEMGLEPRKVTFVLGLNAVSVLSKQLWQRKRELFTKLGWSEKDFASAFRKQPLVMHCSENKINEGMDFLVNTVGLTPSETAMYPNLLLLSVERRLVPRCSVLHVLMSIGKFKKQTPTIFSALNINSKTFLDKYVTSFEKDVPEIVKAYQVDIALCTYQLYKGRLENGTYVTIRSLALKKCSIHNLRVRLDWLSKLHHPHLVGLLGHCVDGEDFTAKVFLVYEFIPKGSYHGHLSESGLEKVLKWPDRLAVLIGVAKAVHFLHTGVIPGSFNNRLKTNNILLDEHHIAKLSNYGMSILTDEIEKLERKGEALKSSKKTNVDDDVYNFEFVLLESLVGPIVKGKGETFLLKEMASFGSQDGRRRIADPIVLTTSSQELLQIVISITNKCISPDPSSRPSFEDVLWNLQYAAQVQGSADAEQ